MKVKVKVKVKRIQNLQQELNILYYLESYLLVNEEVMDPEAVEVLKEAIKYQKVRVASTSS